MSQPLRLSFDRDAPGYAAARPAYPPRVFDVLAHCGLGAGARVLEIGAGSGQATRELLRRGAHVVAIEPGTNLATALSRIDSPRLTVIQSDLERATVPDGPYDLAVAATSFHWLDLEVALPRLAGLLRPGGWLVVWWTVFADPVRRTPFRTAMDDLYRRFKPDEGRGHPGPLGVGSWSAELRRGGWFGDVTVDLIPWSYRLTPDRARGLWATFTNIIALDEPHRSRFLDEVAALVERFGGEVDDPYVTAVYRTRPSRVPT